MSHLNPVFQELSFDPEEVIAVNQACELACPTLQNIGQLEVNREVIASGILQAARSGERDSQQTVRACYPWIDHVRLSAASHLKQSHRQSRRQTEKAPLVSGAFSVARQ